MNQLKFVILRHQINLLRGSNNALGSTHIHAHKANKVV